VQLRGLTTQRPATWADIVAASNQPLLQSAPETISEGAASVPDPSVGDSGPPFQLVEHSSRSTVESTKCGSVAQTVSDDGVRAVLSAFAGRLHKDTSAEALAEVD